MARPRTRVPLNVFLNGRLVGQLGHRHSGAIEFQYHPDWLGWEHTLPISLSLPLREDRYTGAPVLAVFDNLLPDNEAIRRRMAERLHAAGHDPYSLLSKIGRDCVGAIQLLPDGQDPGPAGAVAGRRIGPDEIARRIGDLATRPLGMDTTDDFRISIAGAHQKTALLRWKGRWHLPQGSTATTHIFKPSIGRLPNGIDLTTSVDNEYLCLKLVAAFGLPTADAAIAEFGGHRVLVVQRFDRLWTKDDRLLRVPQEDCCQALGVPPTYKYEAEGGPGMTAILGLLKGSDDPHTDRRTFLAAQIMFWLLGATDGHAKNFSVFLEPGGRFRLAPLYDVVSTQPALVARELPKNKMKLALAVGDHRHYNVHEIAPRHFQQTAARNGLSSSVIPSILDDFREREEVAVAHVLGALPDGFPAAVIESILDGLRVRLRIPI